jgi:LPPG:FO 2-phospho-L-lactate transferase
VKGPAAKLMAEIGLEVTSESVARFYDDVLNGFVDDLANPDFELTNLKVVKFNTIMRDNGDKINLAYRLLNWLEGSL